MTTEEGSTMQQEFLVHAQYSVPYADTVSAVREALEADGVTSLRFGTNIAGDAVREAPLTHAETR